jgi:hypothetical protein
MYDDCEKEALTPAESCGNDPTSSIRNHRVNHNNNVVNGSTSRQNRPRVGPPAVHEQRPDTGVRPYRSSPS